MQHRIFRGLESGILHRLPYDAEHGDEHITPSLSLFNSRRFCSAAAIVHGGLYLRNTAHSVAR
jgi:hypothetical protein